MPHEELKVSKTVLTEFAAWIIDRFMDSGEGDWIDCSGDNPKAVDNLSNEELAEQFMQDFGYHKV